MTREEAIDCLEGLKIYLKTEHIDQEAVDIAIEVLQRKSINGAGYEPTGYEPVMHGEWVHEGVDYMTGQECWSRLPCFCSECKQETRAYFHNYCPNCGAKMDKE